MESVLHNRNRILVVKHHPVKSVLRKGQPVIQVAEVASDQTASFCQCSIHENVEELGVKHEERD